MMGGAVKYFTKKLLSHDIFRSMVSPPPYILNVRSLRNVKWALAIAFIKVHVW